MGKLKTPVGEITVSRDMEKFFKEVGRVSGKRETSKRNPTTDGYTYKWSYSDGYLKTTITLNDAAKSLKKVAV